MYAINAVQRVDLLYVDVWIGVDMALLLYDIPGEMGLILKDPGAEIRG